jgi:hypothetical protein
MFVWPIIRVTMRKQGELAMPEVIGRQIVSNNMLVHGPALIAAGIFGILLVVISEDAIQFSDTWISIAFVLWFLLLGVLFLGLVPAERRAAEPSETPGADARASMFGGMIHVLLFLQLIVMIWQPG